VHIDVPATCPSLRSLSVCRRHSRTADHAGTPGTTAAPSRFPRPRDFDPAIRKRIAGGVTPQIAATERALAREAVPKAMTYQSETD
jgi:hypothetical protein